MMDDPTLLSEALAQAQLVHDFTYNVSGPVLVFLEAALAGDYDTPA